MTLTHIVNTTGPIPPPTSPRTTASPISASKSSCEMNRHGMMVDISHIADKTFYDALAVSRAPLIASHSSCRALCDVSAQHDRRHDQGPRREGRRHPDQLPRGLSQPGICDADRPPPVPNSKNDGRSQVRCGEDAKPAKPSKTDKVLRAMVADGKLPRVDWKLIVDHIDHAVKLVGAEHVGLGSDFDGADMPFGMEDASDLPKITEELMRRGYTDSQIQDILGENTLRLMEQVEKVSRDMQAEASSR